VKRKAQAAADTEKLERFKKATAAQAETTAKKDNHVADIDVAHLSTVLLLGTVLLLHCSKQVWMHCQLLLLY